MSLETTLGVLRSMPLFRSLDERRLKLLAMSGTLLTFRAGERLWEQGAAGETAVVVLEGGVDVLLAAGSEEIRVATLGRGEIVGEMAVLTGSPRSTAAAAAGETRVLELPGEAFTALLREFPDLAMAVIHVLARRLEATNAKLA